MTRSELRQWLAGAIAATWFLSWMINLYVHQDWLQPLGQIVDWLSQPEIHYTPIQVAGPLSALVASAEIVVIGTLAAGLILRDESSLALRRIAAAGFGFGFTGLVTIMLGIAGQLYWMAISATTVYLVFVLLILQGMRDRFAIRPYLVHLEESFLMWRFDHPRQSKSSWLFLAFVAFLCLSVYYHAVATPIVHWDAQTYHAVMAKIMFYHHGIPVITGPGVGLEMSDSFPPLFSALGAFYDVQVGQIEDMYLRLIPPIVAVLLLFVVYQIGEFLLDRRYGKISVLLLAISPIYLVHAMYAISYLMQAFFVSTSLLFLLYGVKTNRARYWITSGVFLGFDFLTSYQGFFYAVGAAAACLSVVAWAESEKRMRNLRNAFLLALATILTGSVWYLRNLLLVGNPIYPFAYGVLGGINIEPGILATTIRGVNLDSYHSFFGTYYPSWQEWIGTLLVNRSSFPTLTILTIPGIILALCKGSRSLWWVAAIFTLIPALIVLSGVANIFTRYFIPFLPGIALLTALPIAKAMGWAVRQGQSELTSRRPVQATLAIGIALTFIFPTSLVVFGGKNYPAVDWATPAPDYLVYLRNPGMDKWDAVNSFYGGGARGWRWLDEHLQKGQRVATYDTQIYYIKDADNDYFFYLDGWEARELYKMQDPEQIERYLRANNVSVVFDVIWWQVWERYNDLPLNRYLGSPKYFPIVFQSWDNTGIYHVGPLDEALTAQSPLAVSLSPDGWSGPESVGNGTVRSVLAHSNAAGLYVETPPSAKWVWVQMVALDIGTGWVAFNLEVPGGTFYNYASVRLTNTGEWKAFRFQVPVDPNRGFVELGIQTSPLDVPVRSINASLELQ
ncbi:MAG: glycosyltransferase family 39 protein [Chloroflexi bacterium]|nr:glycosyltransferase family 39 protein [Chloroflexota bacterium]